MRKYLCFIIFASVFFLFVFIIENINGRFWLNDFKVYYLAAQSLLEGKQVYGTPFGLETGYYKYSPFILFAFTPYCLMPYTIACVIHFAIISICSIAAIITIQRIVSEYIFKTTIAKKNLLLILVIFCILTHITRELHLGNVNIILVFILSAGLLFTLQSRYIISGICIGIAIMVKPYFLILLLPLLFHKKIKTLLYIVLSIFAAVLLPCIILGIEKGIHLHKEWFIAMSNHNTYLTSSQTIFSILKYYLFQGLSDRFLFYIILMIVTGYLVYYYFNRTQNKYSINNNEIETRLLISGYFGLLAMIPNLLITDTEHFLFSLPLIIILLNYLFLNQKIASVCAFIVLIFFYAWNSTDLLGRTLADTFSKMGLLGISNLLIIAWSIFLMNQNKKLNLNELNPSNDKNA